MVDVELESFKIEIDLRVYAAGQGYELDRNKSWRGSAVMRHGNGDKIVISRDTDGHYIYYSVHGDHNHKGSIIDFVSNTRNLTLGKIRQELRPWIGRTSAAVPEFAPLVKTTKNRLGIAAAFAEMRDPSRYPYLEDDRHIPPEVLQRERFTGTIRIDARGNTVFPHHDEDGLSGYEVKNAGFTGFSPGGTKGIWTSCLKPDDDTLVVCESAIDAISYAALYPDPNARYASIGGKPNPVQPELIRTAAAQMPTGSLVIAAMDADQDGRKLAEIVRGAVELAGRRDLQFVVHEPMGCKDFNDELRRRTSMQTGANLRSPSVA